MAQVALADGLPHQVGDQPVDPPPAHQGLALDVTVATHAQQQRYVGQPVDEHTDAARVAAPRVAR